MKLIDNNAFQRLRRARRASVVVCCALLFCVSAFASDGKRSVELEWEAIRGAREYELEVTPQGKGKDAKRLYFKTKKTVFNGKVKAGRYTMRLRSYDRRGVAGSWSAPAEFWAELAIPELISPQANAQVQTKAQDQQTVTLKWQPVEMAQGYIVTLQARGGDLQRKQETTDTSVSFELPVAREYTWTVQTIAVERHEGEQAPPRAFTLLGEKLAKPQIEEPATRYVQELTWSASEKAAHYNVVLSKKTRGRWQVIEKKTSTDTKLPFASTNSGGVYRLQVVAEAPLREKSDMAQVQFQVARGDRSPAAIEQAMLKESIEKPYGFYLIGSYFVTQLDYQATYHENNTVSRYSVLGSKARVGVGYNLKNSNWGGSVTGEVGAISLDAGLNTHTSLNFSGTYQHYWGVNQLRWSVGASYRELPANVGNSQLGSYSMEQVASLGPEASLRLWHPINFKYGILMDAIVYQSMMSVKTPNGQAVQPSFSYQASLLGSYRMTKNLMGYAGYSYRVEEVSYKAKPGDPSDPSSTLASEGDVNSVSVTGHYLNLILEYNF